MDPRPFSHHLALPPVPAIAVRETNAEMLHRLGHDLSGINEGELTALDVYRLFGKDAHGRPTWG
jgi:hypothetical protein